MREARNRNETFASGLAHGNGWIPQPNVVQSPDGTRLWCLQADAKIENANHHSQRAAPVLRSKGIKGLHFVDIYPSPMSLASSVRYEAQDRDDAVLRQSTRF